MTLIDIVKKLREQVDWTSPVSGRHQGIVTIPRESAVEVLAALDGREEWTCGHVAGSMCAECYRQLAVKANELAEENLRLREEIELVSK